MAEFIAPHTESGRPIVGKLPLALACGLAIGSLALAGFAQLTGLGVLRMPHTPVLEYRDIRFVDYGDRGVEVKDAATGKTTAMLSLAEGGGFIQNVLRGMVMDRTPKGISKDEPYRLARHQDGHLFLHDPATGRRQTVDAFGAVQTAVFVKLLSKGEKQ
jgi:putative photosynthetic complex assembly protein